MLYWAFIHIFMQVFKSCHLCFGITFSFVREKREPDKCHLGRFPAKAFASRKTANWTIVEVPLLKGTDNNHCRVFERQKGSGFGSKRSILFPSFLKEVDVWFNFSLFGSKQILKVFE